MKLNEAHLLLQSTFDALTSHVAVLDAEGVVLLVNRAWRTFFASSGGVGASCKVGDNYVTVCERDDVCAEAIEVARGVRGVTSGDLPDFGLEYACESADGRLWFAVSITRFVGEGQVRVVVSHENVTPRKQAEEELGRLAEQHLQEQRTQMDYFITTTEEERRVHRMLTHRIIMVLEEERRAISFELHDGLTQYVMSSFAFFDSYAASLALSDARLPTDLQKGLKYLQDAVIEARRMVNGLRSLALDELGLVGALEQLLGEERERTLWEEAPLFVPLPIPRFDPMLETAAYRVVQEALSNIRKHAETKRVAVTLQMITSVDKAQRRLQIEVQDWGKGFAVAEKRQAYDHIGLHSMAERVYLLQGTIRIESQPGEGTRIIAEFPVDAAAKGY
jgi:signal transduction histidine kinase